MTETPKEAARRLSASAIADGYKPVALHTYHDEEGQPLYWRIRLKRSDGEKWIRPMRLNGHGWELKEPDFKKKPLYGLHLLKQFPDKPVWIVEGEVKADKLNKLGLVATTSGSSTSADGADWTPLRGRAVILWPDNDASGFTHAGDVARSLQNLGCSLSTIDVKALGLPEKGDVVDWLQQHPDATAGDVEALKRIQAKTENEAWEQPIPFGEINTPDIPTSLLPGWLGAYAEAVSRSTQTPPAMAVMLGLSTVAACLQKRFEVSPYGDGYREPLSLWTVTALPPANRKSSVVAAMTEPLMDWEQTQADALKDAIAAREAERAVTLKRIDKLQSQAAGMDDPEERKSVIEEIAKLKKELPEELRAPRLWTGDVTPERLQGLLAEHNERMALLSDEGGMFEIMSGLYSDGRVNLDVFLQGHAGQSVRVDRGGRMAHLRRPALTFGLAVQRQVIADLAQGSKRRFRGTGALARFLYCMPRSTIGHRDVTRRDVILDGLRTDYRQGIRGLLDIPAEVVDGVEHPRILVLDVEALASWHAFAQFVEDNQGEGGKFESIQDWTGKLPGAALRIAGLLHVVEARTTTTVIKKPTVERALDLCQLLIDHAQAAFEIIGEDQATTDAKHVLKWIEAKSEQEVKQNDIHRALHGRFKTVDRLLNAIRVLQDRSIVSAAQRLPTRKPTIIYRVNPAVLGRP